MKKNLFLLYVLLIFSAPIWASDLLKIQTGIRNSEGEILTVRLEKGENYIHSFPLFLFFKVKNPPQMVLWAETPEGQYIDTLFITEKMASQKWLKAPADDVDRENIRRPGAAPVWAWSRSVVEIDGIPMPTMSSPMADAVTHPTPKAGKENLEVDNSLNHRQFRIFLEVNHSTDFNETYRADILEGQANYNGGAFGNGQPSLIYSAIIDLDDDAVSDSAIQLMGCSDPSGSDGVIRKDLSGITTALNIFKAVSYEFVMGN